MRLTDVLRRNWPAPVITAGLLSAGAVAGRPDDPEYYRSLKQAPFAPPPWAFGPAWVIAKLGVSAAVVRAAHTVTGPDRQRLLALAVADTAVYVTFSYVYFRRRDLNLAAIWTTGDAAITAAALPLLAKHDPRAATALVPQGLWLCLATPVAIYQAIANR